MVEIPELPGEPTTPEKPETPVDVKVTPVLPASEKKIVVPSVEVKKEKESPVKKNSNPKTGVESISGAVLGLFTAASGLFVSKKRKDTDK